MANVRASGEDGEIQYLNTDLDLEADRDLTPLIDALAGRGMYSFRPPGEGGDRLYATLATESSHPDPEAQMSEMLVAIEGLDGGTRALWSACERREFNIGYDCGDRPWAFNNGLSNETLRRAAAVGATLRITIYPQRPPADGGRPADAAAATPVTEANDE